MNTGHMKMTATDFKARCLAVLDLVRDRHETVSITKRGQVVARLVPDVVDPTGQPWRKLRGKPVRWHGDPFEPAVTDQDIEALQ